MYLQMKYVLFILTLGDLLIGMITSIKSVLAQEIDGEVVKENVVRGAPMRAGWLLLGVVGTSAALLAVALIDVAMPAPLSRDAPDHRFIAEIAHEHLVNLTSIGPRVFLRVLFVHPMGVLYVSLSLASTRGTH